jgi:hypothetical protein
VLRQSRTDLDLRALAVAILGGCLLLGCRSRPVQVTPAIEFTRIPPADKGGPDTLDTIEGRVTGSRPGQQVVVFARSGLWWVQPDVREPFTPLQPDSTWKSATHLGTEYAALLVEPGYRPPATTEVLPTPGSGVITVASVTGDPSARAIQHTLEFSGYEWVIRAAPSDRGGTNRYDPANAWTDANGAMHLRIAQAGGDWTCAEVTLSRRLGYGLYRFVVRDVSHLEPAAVLSMFTWDGVAADQNHREVSIELSQWGEAGSTNAQYVVQPYYVPANVARFAAPSGPLTHTLRWEPGRATFRTVRGPGPSPGQPLVAEHSFTSGVPSPGNERLRMNLYFFRRAAQPLQKEAEVVVEEFEYLP